MCAYSSQYINQTSDAQINIGSLFYSLGFGPWFWPLVLALGFCPWFLPLVFALFNIAF